MLPSKTKVLVVAALLGLSGGAVATEFDTNSYFGRQSCEDIGFTKYSFIQVDGTEQIRCGRHPDIHWLDVEKEGAS